MNEAMTSDSMKAAIAIPPAPNSIEETGLEFGFLADLALKTAYSDANCTTERVADKLRLPIIIAELLLQHLYREKLLDGSYVIRTGEPSERVSAGAGVRSYKRLSQVEPAFRCLKGIGLLVRPIPHRLEPRVRAHVRICVLAYYVEWHLRRAWRPRLFAAEEMDGARAVRDPVAPAQPSDSVRRM